MNTNTDDYGTYADAACRATFLARTFQVAVQVQSVGDCLAPQWQVVLPATYQAQLDTMGRPQEPDLSVDIEGDTDDDLLLPHDDGEVALLHQEFDEEQENWARSDDEGWFYPD